jgi:hypothetical protein
MTIFISEFQDVFQGYLTLADDLTKIMDVDDSQDPHILVQSILQNCDCLNRIDQMNLRVLKLTDDWEKHCADSDQCSREEASKLIEAAKAQAVRLQILCTIKSQKLQSLRDVLGKNLEELGKGAQYLKSLKPAKNNYPKFIDSRY